MKTNNRGFQYIQFEDCYGLKCSIQESSCTENRLWVGIDNAEPKIMASKAKEHNIETKETTGWIAYPIPSDVLLSTRMLIDKKLAEKIVKILQDWYKI
jgi:hypothetical protein